MLPFLSPQSGLNSARSIETSHRLDPSATPSASTTTIATTLHNNINNDNNSNTYNTNNSSGNNTTLWHSPWYELICTRPELCDYIQNKNIRLVLSVDVVCSKGNNLCVSLLLVCKLVRHSSPVQNIVFYKLFLTCKCVHDSALCQYAQDKSQWRLFGHPSPHHTRYTV